jgi:hypothetical protein
VNKKKIEKSFKQILHGFWGSWGGLGAFSETNIESEQKLFPFQWMSEQNNQVFIFKKACQN